MENTPLNRAHEVGRRAVKLVRKGQLEEAEECHLRAAEILKGITEKLESDSLCIRSLEAQVEFHERQAALVIFLKEIVTKQGLKLQRMAERPCGNTPETRKVLQPLTAPHPRLPAAEIHKQLQEADSLLQILSGYKYTPGAESKKESSAAESPRKPMEFTRRPKNDAEVIEELQIANSNLRALVDKLLTELQQYREENRFLRTKLEKMGDWSLQSGSSDYASVGDPISAHPPSYSDLRGESFGGLMDVSIRQVYDDVPISELPELAPLAAPPDFEFKF